MNELDKEALCLKRISHDFCWCLLVANHEGDCIGRPSLDPPEESDHGPRRAVQMNWGR